MPTRLLSCSAGGFVTVPVRDRITVMPKARVAREVDKILRSGPGSGGHIGVADRDRPRPRSFPKVLHNGPYTATFLKINERFPGDPLASAQWEIKRRGRVVGYMYDGAFYGWRRPHSSMNKLASTGVQPEGASDSRSPDYGILFDQGPSDSYVEALAKFARAADRLIKWREQHGHAAAGLTPVGKRRRPKRPHATKSRSAKPAHWHKGESALFWAGTGGWIPVKIQAVTPAGNPQILHPVTGKLTVVQARASLEKTSSARKSR